MTDRRESTADARFREALELHRQARTDEAATVYRQVLEWNPRHTQALTFLAVLAFQSNEFARAAQLATSALELDPRSAATHLLLGHSLARLNQLDAAVDSYDRAIVLNPGFADAHRHRADALAGLGRHAAALASYDRALELQSNAAAVPHSNAAEIHNNRGNTLRSLRRHDEAVASYDRAIAMRPQLPEPYFNRGFALHEMKRYDAAIESFTQAIVLEPRYPEAYYGRANALKDMRQLCAALSDYDRAIEIRGDYAEAYVNRGNVLGEFGRFDAALASYESAISLAPGNADAWCNRGSLQSALGNDDEALQSLDRALAIDPDHALAHFTRGTVYCLVGDLANGWPELEWRWKNEHCVTHREKRDFRQPLWLGEEPLSNRTILVYCEQGLGDTIQFCRYVNLLAERGASVIFEVPKSLQPLLRSMPGVTRCVAHGEPLPDFDYYCPLLSLPLAFKTTLGTIPSQIPYLRADPQRGRYWRERLGERTSFRVGVVWCAGVRPELPELESVNDRRNIPLCELAALNLPRIEYFSLQKGQPAEGELAASIAARWSGPAFVDHTQDLRDFGETAALIEQLDLVISVDTSTAHLAGALGKPVWVLVRFDACWRWLRHRSDSPWYSSVRLYRQQRRGDWDGVVQQVRCDLEQLAAREVTCRF